MSQVYLPISKITCPEQADKRHFKPYFNQFIDSLTVQKFSTGNIVSAINLVLCQLGFAAAIKAIHCNYAIYSLVIASLNSLCDTLMPIDGALAVAARFMRFCSYNVSGRLVVIAYVA